ncbi:MAG TPA: undecaprenyl-diphosphate phosphatase [Solirubrobacteraceae bacterium]|nr:undecaprenyl-diphosphate phosphatase [Solirubrobacteraceae bacterium]
MMQNTGPDRELSLGEAVALGLLQGPTELLPVSSSGHTTLIPWLAGRPRARLDPELRKAFEVALHAGAGAALAIDLRGELREAFSGLDRRGAAMIGLSLAPPALAGYTLERTIERRLGGPCSIAAGLIAGAAAMALADARPGRLTSRGRRGRASAPGSRRRADAGPCDGLALGIAQALALIPGVSRNGAALTATRARGFAREDAAALSWHAALGVIVGASALKGWRLTTRGRRGAGLPAGAGRALLAGGASAFVSTLASARVLRRSAVSRRSLLPYAIYRCLLAALAVRRLRSSPDARGWTAEEASR